MTSFRNSVLALSCAVFAANVANAQTEHAAAIAAVELGLIGPGLRDQNLQPQSLAMRMAQTRTPAVSLAVIENGQVIWAKAWGVRTVGVTGSVDTQTLFQAASVSKPVAAAAAMLEVGIGKLALDEDVNRYLRSWQLPPRRDSAGQAATAFAEAVTLRQLLSHRAGVGPGGFDGYSAAAAKTGLPTTLQILNGLPPSNSAAVRAYVKPGTHGYSGGGYTVVEQLVQDASGMAFAQRVNQTVFAPVGMPRSQYNPPSDKDNFARGHKWGQVLAGGYNHHPELAAAGLWSTPTDLARFAIALTSSAANTATVPALLAGALGRSMRTPQGEDWALGMRVLNANDPGRHYQHDGANLGYRATWVVFEGATHGAVVMTNGDEGGLLTQELVRAVAAQYNWPRYLSPVRNSGPLTADAAQQLAGHFRTTDGALLRIEAAKPLQPGGTPRLFAQLPGWQWQPVFNDKSEAGQFFSVHLNIKPDSHGLILTAWGQTMLAQHVERTEAFSAQAFAEPVYLRGSFNQWALDLPMRVTSNGFSAQVQLSAGAHEFKIASANFRSLDLGSLPGDTMAGPGESVKAVPVGTNFQINIAVAGRYTVKLTRDPSQGLTASVERD